MRNYIKFDYSISLKKKNYKIIIFILLLIFTILIFNIFLNQNSNDEIKIVSKQSRRIINNLDNYTETMSEFMVNNDLLNSFNEFKIKHLELKEKEIKVQEDIKNYIKKQLQNEEKEIEVQEDIKIKNNKIQEEIKIKNKAIKFLIENYGVNPYVNLNSYINVNEGNCVKELLNLDIDFSSILLNIDYENLTVSFNYFYNNTKNNEYSYYYNQYNEHFSSNYKIYKNNKENIINNPVYKIIKNKLELNSNDSINEAINIKRDYSITTTFNEIINIIDINDNYYNTIENISFIYPYKSLCNINSINHTFYDINIYNRILTIQELLNVIPFAYISQVMWWFSLEISLEYYNEYNIYHVNNLQKYFINYGYHSIYIDGIERRIRILFNYIKIYNEYEYIKKFINLENIPIIYPIKF